LCKFRIKHNHDDSCRVVLVGELAISLPA